MKKTFKDFINYRSLAPSTPLIHLLVDKIEFLEDVKQNDNNLDKKKESLEKENNDLKKENEKLNEENKNLKNKIKNIEKDNENLISVVFNKKEESLYYPIICKITDTFKSIEEKFYKKHTYFADNEKQNNFKVGKNPIKDKSQTLKELNIKDGDLIILENE